MNDTLGMYDGLLTLKRLSRNNPRIIDQHKMLEIRKDDDSKNILIICKTKKDCEEAIKLIAKDYLSECKVNLNTGILKLNDTTLKFIPVSNLENNLIGRHYKEYYFEEEFQL